MLVGLNLVLWGPAVRFSLVFDDLINIAQNPWIREWSRLGEAFTHHAAGFDPELSTSFYRPMMHVLYSCVWHVAGTAPWAFHGLNLALHLGVVLAVWRVSAALMARWGSGAPPAGLPLLTALFFSVHPVHTEPIAWVAGVTDLSWAIAGLLSVLAYLRALEGRGGAWPAGGWAFVALLCKETGAVVAPLLVLVEWLDAGRRHSSDWRQSGRRLAVPLVGTLAGLVLRTFALGGFAPSANQHVHPWPDVLGTAASLFGRYLAVLVWPAHLSVMRQLPAVVSPGDPWALAGVAGVALFAVLVVTQRARPLVSFFAGVIGLPLLPVLYSPAIESGGSVFGDRYLYVPVMGAAGMLALAWGWVAAHSPSARRGAMVAAAGLGGAGFLVSATQLPVWHDSLSLWTDAVREAPRSAPAQEGLCFALYEARRYEEARSACEIALSVEPGRTDARVNLGLTLLVLERPQEALAQFDEVLRARPSSVPALVQSGLACMVLGRSAEGIARFRRAIELRPSDAEAHNDLGVALVRTGDSAAGRAELELAHRLAPESAEYEANFNAVR